MSREIAEKLMNSQTESEITKIIDSLKTSQWKPLGNQKNNYGIVENQAASPMSAFAEIIINAIDAILLKYYQQKSGLPKFTTLREAAKVLLDQTKETIEVRADGKRKAPNLSVIDTGQGQNPGAFEKNFLGLLQPGLLKQQFPFLQGKYGMGGSGVLPFCGDRGYKLIVSAGFNETSAWSWSIIRKNRDKNRYEYLTKNGNIYTFSGEFMKQEYGSVIKLYNYQLERKSHITSGFREMFDRAILDTPVPIIIKEMRDCFSSEVNKVTTSGGLSTLRGNSQLIQEEYTISYKFDHLGERDINVIIFKDDDTLENEGNSPRKKVFTSRKRTIFFTVNGQRHGDLGRTFIKNRCKKHRVAKDTLVYMDFSDLSNKPDSVDLFKPTRDRLTEKPIAKSLQRGLEEAIKNDQTLIDEENRRRRKVVSEERERKVENFLENLLQKNPALRKYFATGERALIPDPGANPAEIDFHFFPNLFKIISKYRNRGNYETWSKDKTFEKRMPINAERSLMRFELNAPDNYFTREEMSGSLRITPTEIIKSHTLHDGILTVVLEPLPNSQPEEMHSVTIEVTRFKDSSLTNNFKIKYTESVKRSPGKKVSESKGGRSQVGLPNVQPVWKTDWDKHGFGEDDIVKIEDYGEKEGIQLFINMDARPHHQFIARNNLTKEGKSIVAEIFKVGVTMYTTAQYIELGSEYDSINGISPDEMAATAMKGIAQAMLDQHIPDEMLQDLTV